MLTSLPNKVVKGMAEATELVADFITSLKFEDLPGIAVRYAADAITDCVGVALAGSMTDLAKHLHVLLATESDLNGQAYLFGSHRKAGWIEAALYNGSLAHAIDYDDSAHPSYSHPSSHLVPVLFSLGKCSRANGRSLITAYIAGLEVEGKLGRALNIGHYAKGWHASSTFGALAAAATGAKLLGLSTEKVKWALGIAASTACGLRANFGTMTKPLHAGLAAHNGVLAALLAETGFTAAEDILENHFGYLEVFSGGDRPKLEVFSELGNPLEITTDYGLALKPFPSCGSTHTSIEAALEIAREIDGEEIRETVIGVNELASQILIYTNPQNPLQGKFSMQFCIAVALLKKEVNRATFNENVLSDPTVRRLMSKIRVQIDERVRHDTEFGSVVKVTCASGRVEERWVKLAKGKPERWMSREELFAKFLDCSQEVLGGVGAKSAFESLQAIEKVKSIQEIINVLIPICQNQ
jgi:2-methylcitrate dehydratase PrpD